MDFKNQFGQPIGFPLANWTPRQRPPRTAMAGRYCRVEPLNATKHAQALFEANSADKAGRNWTYLLVDPFRDFQGYKEWLEQIAVMEDPVFYAIVDAATGRAVGVASYLRIDPAMGVIEVGHLNFSPAMQRT